MDVFTKKVSLYAIPRPTTKSVLNIILNRYIPEHGEIKSVLSDQGKQFQNKHWAATLERNGIKAILTSIRRPQGNLAERVNREIVKMFRIYCHKDQSKWPEFLPFFETAINESYHDTTEYTPADLDLSLIHI